MSRWNTTPWKIPVTHTKFETRTIPVGTISTRVSSIFQGQIPEEVVGYTIPHLRAQVQYATNLHLITRNGVESFKLKVRGIEVDGDMEQLDTVNKGLMLEKSAKHHIPQATNIPYQPLLIKSVFNKLRPYLKFFLEDSSPALKGIGTDIS